jgi:hypothetical protein
VLHPIGVGPVQIHTIIYDGTVLFLRPIASDMANLQHFLQTFGAATGLCTNILKSEILLIWCEGINVHATLGQFQGRLMEIPCKYLSLPPRIGRLRQDDEQALVDSGRKTTNLER